MAKKRKTKKTKEPEYTIVVKEIHGQMFPVKVYPMVLPDEVEITARPLGEDLVKARGGVGYDDEA